ncbi:hypothetical protein ACFYOD_27185 [Streptomyces sp. NPDC006703]|uniref:hypothetical protein n=1 Tax=Streptomyces sp. NPDC006703 TaxID=3364759 RepID=UPI003692223F
MPERSSTSAGTGPASNAVALREVLFLSVTAMAPAAAVAASVPAAAACAGGRRVVPPRRSPELVAQTGRVHLIGPVGDHEQTGALRR